MPRVSKKTWVLKAVLIIARCQQFDGTESGANIKFSISWNAIVEMNYDSKSILYTNHGVQRGRHSQLQWLCVTWKKSMILGSFSRGFLFWVGCCLILRFVGINSFWLECLKHRRKLYVIQQAIVENRFGLQLLENKGSYTVKKLSSSAEKWRV